MKTLLIILVLLVTIALQLILWAVTEMKRQSDIDRLERRIGKLEREQKDEGMQELHG